MARLACLSLLKGKGTVGTRLMPPPWFYLRNHREDMRKWDSAPTLNLEDQVACKEKQQTASKKGPSRKITALVAVAQFPRQSRRADPPPDPNEGTSGLQLKESGNEYSDQA